MSSSLACDLNFESHMQGFITNNSLHLTKEPCHEDEGVYRNNSDVFLLDYEEQENTGNLHQPETLSDLDCTFQIVKVSQYDLKIKQKIVSSSYSDLQQNEGNENSWKLCGSTNQGRSEDRENEIIHYQCSQPVIKRREFSSSSPLPDLVNSPRPEFSASGEYSDWSETENLEINEGCSDINLIQAHKLPTVERYNTIADNEASLVKSEESEPWLKEIREWALKVCECFDSPVSVIPEEDEKKKKRRKKITEVEHTESISQRETFLFQSRGKHSNNDEANHKYSEKNNDVLRRGYHLKKLESNPDNTNVNIKKLSFKELENVADFHSPSRSSKQERRLNAHKCFKLSYTPRFSRTFESFLECADDVREDISSLNKGCLQVDYHDEMPDGVSIQTMKTNGGYNVYIDLEPTYEEGSNRKSKSKSTSKLCSCFK